MNILPNRFSSVLVLMLLVTLLPGCVTTPVQQPVAGTPTVAPEVMQKYQSALQLMELGDHDAALKVFADVSKMDDSLSGPYVNSGLIYLQQDKKDEARAAFENALQRKPDNAVALTQLAILQRENFELAEARKNYEKALQADPAYGNAHLNLGILCDIYLRDYDCALSHYEEYLRIDDSNKDVKNWLIDLKERM